MQVKWPYACKFKVETLLALLENLFDIQVFNNFTETPEGPFSLVKFAKEHVKIAFLHF